MYHNFGFNVRYDLHSLKLTYCCGKLMVFKGIPTSIFQDGLFNYCELLVSGRVSYPPAGDAKQPPGHLALDGWIEEVRSIFFLLLVPHQKPQIAQPGISKKRISPVNRLHGAMTWLYLPTLHFAGLKNFALLLRGGTDFWETKMNKHILWGTVGLTGVATSKVSPQVTPRYVDPNAPSQPSVPWQVCRHVGCD